MDFSPDGTRVASLDADNTVRSWGVESGSAVAVLEGHADTVTCVRFSPDGAEIASGSEDKGIRLWNSASGVEVGRFEQTEPVWCFAFSPDGTRLASGGSGAIHVWDVASGKEIKSWGLAHGYVDWVAYVPDGKYLFCADGSQLHFWDSSDGVESSSVDLKDISTVDRVEAFSPEGTLMVTGDDEGAVRLWDLRPRQALAPLVGFREEHAFSPDGTRIADADRILDTSSGKEVARLEVSESERFGTRTYSPDGERIAGAGGALAGSGDKTVPIWDATSGKLLRRLRGHTEEVTAVAFNPDGTRIATGSSDGTVRLWDPATGNEEKRLSAVRYVWSVAFSPDGTQLACDCHADRTITANQERVRPKSPVLGEEVLTWDVSTGARVETENAAIAKARLERWLAPRFPSHVAVTGLLEGDGEWRTAWRDPEKDENGLPLKVARIFDRWERDLGMRVNLETGDTEPVAAPGSAYADDPRLAPLCK